VRWPKPSPEKLRGKLTGQEEQVIAAKPTDNVQAYDAYLRGLAYTLKAGSTPANSLGAQKYLKEAVRLDPKFGRCLGAAVNTWKRGATAHRLFNQQTLCVRRRGRQPKLRSLLQPNLGEAVVAKGYYYYACLKDYNNAVRYLSKRATPCLTLAGFPNHWPILPAGESVDQANRISMKRAGWDPANANLLTQRAISYIELRAFPKRCEKLDQVLDITPDDVDTIVAKADIAQQRVTYAGSALLLRSIGRR